MQPTFRFFHLLYISIAIYSCNSKNEYPAQDNTIDFCSKIHRDNSISLDEQIAPFKDKMKNSTGVYMLEEGDKSMVARAWLSEYATKSIDIQYFIFSADNVGLIACDYLLRAADRGVKVRILVDDIMVQADEDELLALNEHPNLTIKIYNPGANIGSNLSQKIWKLATDFKGFNQRMHNKTYIVDKQISITGGRNIADEYFDYDHEYNFRDRDVLLIGKTSTDIQKSFNEFWNDSISVSIDKVLNKDDYELNKEEKFEYLHKYACNPDNFWPQVRERIKQVPYAFEQIVNSSDFEWVDSIQYVSDIPGKNKQEGLKGGGTSTDKLVELVSKAQNSITIQTPYLITTALSRSLFKAATERGVEINILTNSLASTDNLEAFNGYQRDREALLNTGVNVFEFKPDAAIRYKIMTGALQEKVNYTPTFGLHAKSMVIDNKIAVVGTFNLDPRSANLNTECITIIHSDKIAQNMNRIMKLDMAPENAWKTTLNSNPDSVAGIWKQLKAKTRTIVPKSIL